jgi:hypothetical protein
MENLNDVENEITHLNGVKGDERTRAINKIAFALHRVLKENGYSVIDTRFLKTLFNNSIPIRTQQRILKDILKTLRESNKIKDTTKSKTYFRFVKKELKTFDYSSYSTIMQKNGYKSKVFKWAYDEDKHIPKRILLGVFDINNIPPEILGDCDLIENTSYKPKSNQGVFSKRSISIGKNPSKQTIKAYQIL